MSKSRKGVKHKPMSEQGKENIRKSHIGQVAWNKGLKTGPMKDEIKEKELIDNKKKIKEFIKYDNMKELSDYNVKIAPQSYVYLNK